MSAPQQGKVVYWLGAGASAQALPVVGEMRKAFIVQAKRIQFGLSESTRTLLSPLGSERYTNYLRDMAVWSRNYGTIDTYAKSLYLQGRTDELAEVKLHLGMYFLLEQAMPCYWKLRESVPVPKYSKSDDIDTRYMQWLALFLNTRLELNPNVKVISWNYDLQFEHALSIFNGQENLRYVHTSTKIKLFPTPSSIQTIGENFADIIRLNGVAGIGEQNFPPKAMYENITNGLDRFEDFIIELFGAYKYYVEGNNEMRNAMTKTLTFAWEKNVIGREAMRMSKAILSEASILVVIGYSFPLFNREIDRELVEAFNTCPTQFSDPLGTPNPKRVVVQRRGDKADEEFREIFGWTSEAEFPPVQFIKSVTSFYVPPEIS